MDRPRLLVVSHVLPFPGISGQQQRVANTLRGARDQFHITFATLAPPGGEAALREGLAPWCDEVLLLPARYGRGAWGRLAHRVGAGLFVLRTGLKTSNYALGSVEFSPGRVLSLVEGRSFDLALFEYFHASAAATALRNRGIPCVVDTHNVLWQAFDRQLKTVGWLPAWGRRWAVRRYRQAEEAAWRRFNALIAITTGEARYIRSRIPAATPLLKACMGIDLEAWSRCWAPATPLRVGYYGGLGSAHNAREALRVHEKIMPAVWKKFPKAEYWIVGSKPPPEVQALARDPRVKVTGFVERAQEVLKSFTVCLCPWEGTYGFRSRLVEIMAVGVPMVASPDAGDGMDFEHGRGIFFEPDDRRMTLTTLKLLEDPALAAAQSLAARAAVEEHYGFAATYGRLARELAGFIPSHRGDGQAPEELKAAL